MQTVAIIDYGSGNLRSAAKAFERMADELIVTVA
jgi:imidazoleglycerol phosphate synthase glutamine amidotransferase subunit HisH